MKTSEMTGELLDYWVAVADGLEPNPYDDGSEKWWGIDDETAPGGCYWIGGPYLREDDFYYTPTMRAYAPSSNWKDGGPIIEREMIELSNDRDWREDGEFGRVWQGNHAGYGYMDGDTALIAAMRAYVASKFGDTVPDEVAA